MESTITYATEVLIREILLLIGLIPTDLFKALSLSIQQIRLVAYMNNHF